MTRNIWMFVLTFAAGAMVGRVVLPFPAGGSDVVLAQGRKPLMVTRLFTGPDGETHADEQELKFAGSPIGVSQLMKVSSAELHRTAPGGVADWHRGPRRQYVITLSGHGELEVSGGKKILAEPGHIELIEDTTGKGHVTRVTGSEERVTLQLVLADQALGGR
jgi:hypothetical protein